MMRTFASRVEAQARKQPIKVAFFRLYLFILNQSDTELCATMRAGE